MKRKPYIKIVRNHWRLCGGNNRILAFSEDYCNIHALRKAATKVATMLGLEVRG